MKKAITIILLLFLTIHLHSQELVKFPYKTTLKDIHGKSFLSSNLTNNNSPIILEYWASYCKPCISKLNELSKKYDKWKDKYNVKIIVVSIDKGKHIKDALTIIKKNNWPFEFYFDSDLTLLSKLSQFKFVPQSFIFDKKMRKVKSFKGVKYKNPPSNYLDVTNLKVDLYRYKKILKKASK
ncbi:TlpA family protein disulfide reductase [Tenacibaculum sp. A30]|uniref:TlpA family protein disulfide reductase n=1 Tax=Tenacibaculum sp. A30 TaxID=3442644 RepID=UPI003EB94628